MPGVASAAPRSVVKHELPGRPTHARTISGPATLDLVAFMPLVRSIACRIFANIPSYAAIDLNDLMQAGHLGLLNASRAYCRNKRVPFAVYARFRIRGEILDSLRQVDVASRSLRRWERRVRAARQTLIGALQREPTDLELSASLSLGLTEFECKRQALHTASFSTAAMVPIEERNRAEASWVAVEPSPEVLRARSEARQLVQDAIRKLPPRLQQIVGMYYVQGLTMREIANHFHVNESRISQIHRNALDRLARHLRASGVSSTREI